MKLTKAEYRLLDEVIDRLSGPLPTPWLKPSERAMGNRMRLRGLISKRAWARGYVVATALGKRSHSYGKR